MKLCSRFSINTSLHHQYQNTKTTAATKGAPQGALTVPPEQYPRVRRDESVVDDLHGERVPDPYRWLEDPDSKETEAFVEQQNVLTASTFAKCKTRGKFKELMTELYDYPRFGCPSRKGTRYVYSHNTGLQAQSVVYTVSDPDPASGEEPVVLIDPNKLSEDGTVRRREKEVFFFLLFLALLWGVDFSSSPPPSQDEK